MSKNILYTATAIFIIYTFPLCCSATKIADVTFDELFNHVDYVALVYIEKAEALHTATRKCGQKYTSIVLQGLKGATAGELLEWDSLDGYSNEFLEIGSRYLVFLTKSGRRYEPIMSTNSYSEQRTAEFEEICGPVLLDNRVAHKGHGTLPVEIALWMGSDRENSLLSLDIVLSLCRYFALK
jgi:hypothetical protein